MQSIYSQPTLKTAGPSTPILAVAPGRGFRATPLDYGQAPQINPRGFIAAAAGWSQIGQSFQKVGGALSNLALKEAEAINTKKIADSEMIMQQAWFDIATKHANAKENPESWMGIAQTGADEVGKMLLTKDLSPLARSEITLRFEKWKTNLLGETNLAKAKQTFNLTGQTLQVAHKEAVKQGRFGELPGIREEASKYFGPAVIDGMANEEIDKKREIIDTAADTMAKNLGTSANGKIEKLYKDNAALFPNGEWENRISGKHYAAEVSDLMVIANDDPHRALELAPLKLRGPERIRVEDAANESIKSKRALLLKDYEEQIKMGKLPSPDELRSNRYLTDYDRANITDFATQGPKNDPVAFASMFAEAANFKGDEGSPDYAVLANRVNMALDGELKSNVLSKLGEAIKNKTPDELTRSMNEVYSLAKDDLAAGRFGPLHGALADPATELPPKIRLEVDLIKKGLSPNKSFMGMKGDAKTAQELEGEARSRYWDKLNPKPTAGENFSNFVVEDTGRATAAQRRYGNALMSLEKWKKDNPKATPKELRAQYDKFLVVQRAGQGSPLPEVPGGMNNPLLKGTEKGLPTKEELEAEIAKFKTK